MTTHLFDPVEPPNSGPWFPGPAYKPELDHARLTGQLRRVWQVMSDGNWRTVNEICRLTGDPAPSVLAQLGHLRKEKFGAYPVERRRVKSTGLYEYHVGVKGDGVPQARVCARCNELSERIEAAKQRVLEIAVDYGYLVDHGFGAEWDEVIAILEGENT